MTEHEREEIVRRYEEGASISLIAHDTSHGWRKVLKVLADAGVQLRGLNGNGRRHQEPKYRPTEEEILKRAYDVRMKGYIDQDGNYVRPWTKAETRRRMVMKAKRCVIQVVHLIGCEQRGNYSVLDNFKMSR